MEQNSVFVENVKNLQDGGRQMLEHLLGRQLDESQQVLIMVLSPGVAPDQEARCLARAGLEATFRKTERYAQQHGIEDAEIDCAIEEAMDNVRPR